MLTAAGVLSAFDKRDPIASELAGLLQATSYIAGVSGGSWLLSSLIMNDFKPVVDMKNQTWNFEMPLLEGLSWLERYADNEGRTDPERVRMGGNIRKREVELHNLWFKNISMSSPLSEKVLSYLLETQEQYHKTVKPRISATESQELKMKIGATSKVKDNAFSSFLKRLFNKGQDTDKGLLHTPKDVDDFSVLNYYLNLHLEVRSKKLAGFQLSLIDYWGRALMRRISPDGLSSMNFTFSEIFSLPSFQSSEQPFPILLADIHQGSEYHSSIDSHVLEINPFEIGSWEPHMKAYMKLRYLGSTLIRGEPVFYSNGSKPVCVENYDNLGFLTAASSSLFNCIFWYLSQAVQKQSPDTYAAFTKIFDTFGLSPLKPDSYGNHSDYALINPNPFLGYPIMDDKISSSSSLHLVDGGEDKQNIPFVPLLWEKRQVDVIIAIDSSSDIGGYPNGTTLVATNRRFNQSANIQNPTVYYRHENDSASGTPSQHSIFPIVPTYEEIVQKGLNKRPTFFGCHLDESFALTGLNNSNADNNILRLPPLIVYLANTQSSFASNTSTFRLSYNKDDLSKMIQNGHDIGTYSHSMAFEDYPKCLGCALLKREFDKKTRGMESIIVKNATLPKYCKRCFAKYCYS
ncbi:BA75_03281T0 [Komagataella pastoris]|uniref:Lysophospholipase n=1 Tax=Komagataella pastoris TaxID=4922 RepID=A0A1B2JCS1_PICPA|nr:BA75_03281T0 [Komagataella pastoris]